MSQQPAYVPLPAYRYLMGRYRELISSYEGLAKQTHLTGLPEKDPNRNMLLANLEGTQVPEALHIIEALNATRRIEGDVCEFGIAQGATSALIAHEIRHDRKELWLYDSFEGLPAPSSQDQLKNDIFNLGSIEAYQGTMKCPRDMVLKRLNAIQFPHERLHIVEGFIEKTMSEENTPGKVSFAYVDFDFYEPIRIALQYLHRSLTPGGIVIVDDYDFFSTGARLAVDEFVDGKQNVYQIDVADSHLFGHFAVLKKRSA